MRQRIGAMVAPALARGDGETLKRSLYLHLRRLILTGVLPAGSRLPSSRTLAQDLSLSRSTVLAALDRLAADGYITARVGAGSFVSTEIANVELIGKRADRRRETAAAVSHRGRALVAGWSGSDARVARAFTAGVPSLDEFPLAHWQQCLRDEIRDMDPADLTPRDPLGEPELRAVICQHLGASRGVHCTPEQVAIFSGSQQAIDAALRIVTDPGDPVVVEEPCFPGVRAAVRAAGATLVPVPVDADGLQTSLLDGVHSAARVAIVTPSSQFPLACTMALPRRQELLRWARTRDGWIIEGDYEGDFVFDDRQHLTAIQGLDPDSRVIYVGTFTQTMYPALRVAYAVVPARLIDAFRVIRRFSDGYTSPLQQAALRRFISRGYFAAHLRRMRQIYAVRRDRLVDTIRLTWGDRVSIEAPRVGLHAVARFAKELDDVSIAARAAAMGVEVLPLSRHYTHASGSGFVLGFACVPTEEIRPALHTLLDAVRAHDCTAMARCGDQSGA